MKKTKLMNLMICGLIISCILISSISNTSGTAKELFSNNKKDIQSDNWYWTELHPSNFPPARNGHAMVYDSKANLIILFGGYNGTVDTDDTWVYNPINNSWINMHPKTSPPGRRLSGMVYDEKSDLVILFGGNDETNSLSDTWVYNLKTNSWTEKIPSTSPPARYGHKMVYDSMSDMIILQGGIETEVSNWIYILDNNTWIDKTYSDLSASVHVMAYDSKVNSSVLYGAGSGHSDTWVYTSNDDNWTQLIPDNKPNYIGHSSMVYDQKRDNFVLFGGENSVIVLGETWSYSYSKNNWEKLIVSIPPINRLGHQMAYASKTDQIILYGGISGAGGLRFNDTWSLTFGVKPENVSNSSQQSNTSKASPDFQWYFLLVIPVVIKLRRKRTKFSISYTIF